MSQLKDESDLQNRRSIFWSHFLTLLIPAIIILLWLAIVDITGIKASDITYHMDYFQILEMFLFGNSILITYWIVISIFIFVFGLTSIVFIKSYTLANNKRFQLDKDLLENRSWLIQKIILSELMLENVSDWLKESALIDLADYATKLALLISAITYLQNINEQKIFKSTEAWKTLSSTRNTFTSHPKDINFTKALEYLINHDDDVSGVSLNGRQLQGFNFSGGQLTESSFINGILNNANFDNSHLEGSCFLNAILYNSSFRFARLQNASFKNAKISTEKWLGAKTTGSDFADAKLSRQAYINIKLTEEKDGNLKNFDKVWIEGKKIKSLNPSEVALLNKEVEKKKKEYKIDFLKYRLIHYKKPSEDISVIPEISVCPVGP